MEGSYEYIELAVADS